VDLGIAGRVALVTASSRGLGRASADALAGEGVKLVVCGRDESALETAAAELGRVTDVLAVAADVTDPASPRRLVDAAVERFGRLDIVVANAGGPPSGRALEVDDAALEAAVNANLLTSVRLVREALPHLRAQGWGRICLIASWAVKQPVLTLTLSNTARTGLWAWAKTAAADLFPLGVTLNMACPGYHATERLQELGVPEGPVGDPADFGRVVAFLCSQPAGFVSGTALMIDGARSVALL
jgi:3-oxoacyl-[acyl-carrier protein] reductase